MDSYFPLLLTSSGEGTLDLGILILKMIYTCNVVLIYNLQEMVALNMGMPITIYNNICKYVTYFIDYSIY